MEIISTRLYRPLSLSLLRTYEIPFGPTVTNEENEKTTVRRADAQPIMKVLNQA